MKTRRTFIRNCLLAGALPLLPSIKVRGLAARKVVVVGAGLAGLVCAYELNEAGYDVIVLEAQGHPGGKVRTIRDGFADGQYAEAGGESFFPVEPNYAQQYIEKFNLKVQAPSFLEMKNLQYLYNQRVVVGKDQLKLKFPLTNQEIDYDIDGMRKRYIKPIVDELTSKLDVENLNSIDRRYDDMSMEEAMMKNGASPEAVRLLNILNRDYVGEGPENYSAADMIGAGYNVFHQFTTLRGPFLKIEGGNDLLPEAFSKKLNGKTKYNAIVKRISQDANQVTLHYSNGHSDMVIICDYAVLAVPPRPALQIDIDKLSPEKRDAFNTIPMTSVSRMYYQTKTRVWNADGLNGSCLTDLPIHYVWENTWGQPGEKGILNAYMVGKHARYFDGLSHEEKITYTLNQFEILFPGFGSYVDNSNFISWAKNPFTTGYSFFRPGQMQKFFLEMKKSEGRLFFAGAHTASRLIHNSMQGALESGIRAAKEVLALG